MVEKFFLALDYPDRDTVVRVGLQAVEFLDREFGSAVNGKLGVKLNQDLFTGSMDTYHPFDNRDVFADMKISHGAGTGKKIIDNIKPLANVRYVTVAAGLCPEILREYVSHAHKHGIDVVAFTAHTNIPEDQARRVYHGETMSDVIFNLGEVAYDGGCDAIVLEGAALEDPRIRNLRLKKVVTGVRIDPNDKGQQRRVTALDSLSEVKQMANYVVVSSRYLGQEKRPALAKYFAALL